MILKLFKKIRKIFFPLSLLVSLCFLSCNSVETPEDAKAEVHNDKEEVLDIAGTHANSKTIEDDRVESLKPPKKETLSQKEVDELLNKQKAMKDDEKKTPFYHSLLKKGEKHNEVNKVTITFNAAPIEEVVPVFSKLLKFNFYLDPKVAGVVTMSIDSKLTQKNLWEIFEQILWLTGSYCSLDDDMVHILPFDKMAKERNIFSSQGTNVSVVLFKLKNAKAKGFIDHLKPFVTEGATIIDIESQNAILVVEAPGNIEKLRRIVNILDTANKVNWPKTVIKCAHIPPSAIAKELVTVLPVLGFPVTNIKDKNNKKTEEPGTINIQGIDRMGLLIVSAANWEAVNEVKNWVFALDRADVGEQDKVFVYNIINGQADHIIQALSVVFNIKGETLKVKPTSLNSAYGTMGNSNKNPDNSSSDSNEAGSLPAGMMATAYEVGQIGGGNSNQINSSGNNSDSSNSSNSSSINSSNSNNSKDKYPISVFDVPTKVFADAINERLLIRTTDRVYAIMKALLTRIDTIPSQVLLKVTIADVLLTAKTNLGLQIGGHFQAQGAKYQYGTDYSIAIPPEAGGLGFGGGGADKASPFGALQALAIDNKVTVLATPEVLVQSNTQALVSVGDSIPMAQRSLTNTNSGGGGTADMNVTNNYNYKDTGVILKITPHITKGGLITCDIDQLVSTVDTASTSKNGGLTPTIRQRRVVTTLSLPDKGTIIIAGLINEQKSDILQTIPFIGNIPIINRLFGNTTIANTRNELLLMVTANIVTKTSSLDQMIERYRNSVKLLMNENSETNVNNNIILDYSPQNTIILK
jgi:general secretion pathway protein D